MQGNNRPTVDDTLLHIAEEAADGLYIVDPDGTFAFVNRAAVELFGYEDESELLGRNSHATTHYMRRDGSPFPVEECPLLRPRTTGERVRVDDDCFIRKDGSMFPVAYSSAPFAMESGTGAVVAIRDMSGLRHAEAELQLLQTATALISSAEDFEAAVACVIRAVCEQTGWVAGEMWMPDADCVQLRLAPGWWAASPEQERFFRDVSSKLAYRFDEGLPGMVWQSKQPFWIDVTTTDLQGPRIRTALEVGFVGGVGVPVLANDEVVAVLGFFRDRVHADDELWTASLSTIAAQLGPVFLRKRAEEQLAAQAIELANSNAELRRFAQLTAHELHQPLQSIIYSLEHSGNVAAEGAIASARRLQESIEGLLRYASVGQPHKESVPTATVVDEVLADLSYDLERAEADVVRHDLPAVEANAAQLRNVFLNLISNAVRYRSAEPLRIEIGAEREPDAVRMYVRDNGVGVDARDGKRIFELFNRGASASDVEGLGIGLALTRRIVEAHRGEIWLESEPGRGSTFLFRLPASG